ncbi:MAG: N-acetyltransferase [Oscillospiraceae bacterium]
MLTIRTAAAADQPQLMAIYRTAQEYMLQTGNPTQWGRSYPSPELIRSDIAQGICRVLSDEAGIHGVLALLDTPEPTYSRKEGAWRNDAPYLTIHRLAGDGRTHGLFRCRGLLQGHFPECSSGYPRRQPHHAAFAGRERLPPCGTIHVRDGTPRLAYHWTADRP